MHIHIQDLLHHYGYWGIFFILLLEMVGIPFPAETTLTLSGIEWAKGVFSLLPLFGMAVFGNVVGSSIAYGVGRFLGRPVILRLGKFVGITDKRLDQAENTFSRYKILILVFSKFIAGIRVLVPYIAGINRMSFMLFSICNFVSAMIWCGVFIVFGRYLGFAWHRYHHVFHKFFLPILFILIVAAVFYQLKKKMDRRKENG
jgi:membrane protein DedA with SNARE-associated domain